MPWISLTRLHLRSARFLPAFMWHAAASTRQIKRSPGLLEGWLATEGLRGFWTLTAWANEAAMRAYRDSGAHRRAMPKLLAWCDEASVAHWRQEAMALPGIGEAADRMVAEGRLSKVRHPSPSHAAGRIVPISRPLRPGPRLRPAII